MKAEKIEKHMLRRTVVVARGGVVKGVINNADGSAAPVLIAGVSRLSALHGGLYNGWFPPEEIRKATDAERAEFFAWLVSDGRDITDGFARFGGMPRGFEAWRAAQTPAAEPTPEPAAFVMGQRVRIVKGGGDTCLRGFEDGDVCEVVDPDTGGEHSVRIGRGELRGYARPDQLEPVADEPTPEPVVTPQHKVGDLRVGLDYDGLALVGRVSRLDRDRDVWIGGLCRDLATCPVFEPTPENVALLVTQQRERGIVPERGDLLFVLFPHPATALVAHNVSTAPDAQLLQGVMVGGGAISWGLAPDIAAHTLVIRRCPFREVADE